MLIVVGLEIGECVVDEVVEEDVALGLSRVGTSSYLGETFGVGDGEREGLDELCSSTSLVKLAYAP